MSEDIERLQRNILGKLVLLAEGGVAPMDKPNLHRSAPESSPPPGAFQPLEEVSLALYYEKRFDDVRESKQWVRLKVVAEAERDWELAAHKRPRYLSPDSDENAKNRDEAVLRWEGKRPEWVAVFEGCSESYVRKLRKKAGRDPKTGMPSGRVSTVGNA